MKKILTAVAAAIWLTAGPAIATQGVTKNEIVLGSIQDMSGPLASYSKPLVNGMRMHIDEINEAGGINGRKLKLIVEDSGYDPKKGLLAAQKLVQRDQVFAVAGTIGTARRSSGRSRRRTTTRCGQAPSTWSRPRATRTSACCTRTTTSERKSRRASRRA
jgi:branched-chain amino acid transport system substrate-binding protein